MNYTDKAVNDVFHLLNFPAPPIRPIEDIYGKTVYQLIAFFTAEQEKRIMKVLSHCESTRWNPLFTDIVPLGSSKRVGIDKMLEHYHIGLDECMAFGDGGNDIQMLSHVGICGRRCDECGQLCDDLCRREWCIQCVETFQHYLILNCYIYIG